ncbi:MAG TPA: twin-arginine translocase TatA/TatE family subunit [Acidimicrobiia bacterium]|nr:twin-arginine translocase TatA/TatE family subunit [Acidimicrobiia bacterium]
MPQIGPLEILVVLVVALVVFGPSKLPELGRQVGRGYREFRKFQQGIRDDIEDAFRDDEGHGSDGADDAPRQLEPPPPDRSAPPEPPAADTTS